MECRHLALVYRLIQKVKIAYFDFLQRSIFDLNANHIAANLVEALIEKGLTPAKTTEDQQSMALILSALIIELKTTVQKSLINFADSTNSSALPLLTYINTHYADATLASVSEHFGYNRNYLSDKLRKATGKGFQELIDQRRLAVAENLIIKTNQTNITISTTLGYKNVTSLFRLFQRYLQLSPNQYRRKVHREVE